MKREPTPLENESMLRAVASGDRIQAISLYMGITECGLTQAQEFVRGLTPEHDAAGTQMPEFSPRKKLFRLFGR